MQNLLNLLNIDETFSKKLIKPKKPYNTIKSKLELVGDFIRANDIRVSFHPSHFCILSSEQSRVVDDAIKELNQHGEILDLMGLSRTHYYKINIR